MLKKYKEYNNEEKYKICNTEGKTQKPQYVEKYKEYNKQKNTKNGIPKEKYEEHNAEGKYKERNAEGKYNEYNTEGKIQRTQCWTHYYVFHVLQVNNIYLEKHRDE